MTVAEREQASSTYVPFAVEVAAEGGATVVFLHGEADGCTLRAVSLAIARAISDHDGPVIIDLADTTFVDIGTVRVIGRAAGLLERSGRTLAVRAPSRTVVRVMGLLGLADLLRTSPGDRITPEACSANGPHHRREAPVYIGLGTIVFIIVIILLFRALSGRRL